MEASDRLVLHWSFHTPKDYRGWLQACYDQPRHPRTMGRDICLRIFGNDISYLSSLGAAGKNVSGQAFELNQDSSLTNRAIETKSLTLPENGSSGLHP